MVLWYFVGVGSTSLVFVAAMLADGMDRGFASTLLQIAALGAAYGPLIPAIVRPRREDIELPADISVHPDCYRDGYRRRALIRRCGGYALGSLTVQGAVIAGGLVWITYVIIDWMR